MNRIKILVTVFLMTLLLGCSSTQSENNETKVSNNEIENHIKVYVTPYYFSADTLTLNPKVKVSKEHDNLLSSTKKEDILRAEKLIQNKPELITPMTMMVLSIRLYDVGERDKSVFWFYAAKDRFITLADVLDINHSSLFQVKHAVSAFASLAGPYINSYAFCDIDKQRDLRKKAFKWVSSNPYKALFIPQLPAKNGDREENLANSINEIEAGIKKMDEYLSIQENIDSLKQQRQQKGVNEQFCF